MVREFNPPCALISSAADLQAEFRQVQRARFSELPHEAWLRLFTLWLSHLQRAKDAVLARMQELLQQRAALAERRDRLPPGAERTALDQEMWALTQEAAELEAPHRPPPQLGTWVAD